MTGAVQETLLIIKPDGVRRSLVEVILERVRAAGFQIVSQKKIIVSQELGEKLYEVHRGKPFFESLMKYIQSGQVVAVKLEAPNAVARLRELIGATDPAKAAKGSIRGDLRDPNPPSDPSVMENLVHASDSPENAKRELSIFFHS